MDDRLQPRCTVKIGVFCASYGHYKGFLGALQQGIQLCGDQVVPVTRERPSGNVDAFVCWGWRTGKRLRQLNPGVPVLCVERGYVGDRFHWTSLGWNGLNGRAIFPRPRPNAQIDYSSKELLINECTLQPWRAPMPGNYALIMGQVQSDQACLHVSLRNLYREWASTLSRSGWEVRYRAHPKARTQPSGLPLRVYTQNERLEDDLKDAAFTVSFNSNSSVISVLSGVPSVTFDEGAMAWSVTSHDLANPVTMPSRTEWAAQLAWCQWLPDELANGTAWRAVREVKPCLP